MSQVYASGVRATALANIKAALLASMSVGPNGTYVVNTGNLSGYFRAEFESIATTDGAPPGGVEAVRAVVRALDTARFTNDLVRILSASTWSGRADWPGNVLAFQGDKASMLLRQKTGIANAVSTLQAQYETAKSSLLARLPSEYDVGVAPYITQPTLRAVETRSYICTYVTDRGEESGPSEASTLIELDQNDQVQVTVPAPPSGRFITPFRLYRSSATYNGQAFQLVPAPTPVGFPIGTLTVTDAKSQEELQEPCPTLSWAEPPEDLEGLISMPNGVLLGYKGTQLFFSEPYKPHAWPLEYSQPVGHRIVGGGVFGQTAVMLTVGVPYYVTGADSASMSVQRVESRQSCVGKRSIADAEGGILYASPDGVCLAGPSGVELLTRGAVRQQDWQALNPAGIVAEYQDGVYYMFFQGGRGATLDLVSRRIATFTRTTTAAYAALETDTLYVVSGTALLPLFSASPPLMGRWRSRIVVTSAHHAFNCLRVESNFEFPVTIRVYASGVLWHTATFANREPQRLPPGRFREFEIEVESQARVTQVVMATSITELATQ